MILLIDNYDSFTYNLFQFMSELGAEVEVARNDRITLAEIVARRPQKIVISPGPCTPLEAGISNDIIRQMGNEVPILGVCLGHQCIGQVFGATVAYAGEIMHGKTSKVTHDNAGVFTGLPNPLEAIRYHSLAVVPETVPSELDITAWSDTGVIMGLRHKTLPIEGIQFHPESIMTENGKDLLSNFLTR